MAKNKKAQKGNALTDALAGVLADTYIFMLKVHGFHWNVRGPRFQELHTFFETQYTEAFAAVDLIAERLRALGAPAPASFARFQEIAAIKEAGSKPLAANDMVAALLADHEKLSKRCAAVMELADDADDDVTEDLMIQRQTVHDKTAWMLRVMLET